jgi:carboxyl-terminal processing protease
MFSNTISKVLALVSGIMILGSFINNPVNDKEREALILQGVMTFIDKVHFDPKPVDDSLSLYVYNRYLEATDSGKRFLLDAEVAQLELYQYQIDEQVSSRTFEFFDASIALIDNGMARAKGIYEAAIKEPMDFSIDESFELDPDKREWAKDEGELKEHWRKMLKYNVLSRIEDKLAKQEEADYEGSVTPLDSLTMQSIEKVKDNYDKWFERIEKTRRSDRFETYVGSITRYFDPHTNYFNPKEKANFDINMGGKLEGIGARLQSDGEETKVMEVIPGGPAWKGKELEVEDIILKVRQEDEEEPLIIGGMRLDDVVQKIRGKKDSKVFLTLRKVDGSIEEIQIIRDVVDLDESKAKSLLLDHSEIIDNVGYIKLPKFYSDFKGGSSCAVDVKKELEKLNEYDVNGVILDLRNNTGGSLGDVVDMSGLFIEEGPIVQVKPRGRDPYVHKDEDKSVTYDGPLIVLVNNVSASASEILAAALQDYGRAVIVGGTTFGKGTVQRFYDLDRAFTGANELKPLGNLKMTMQKFYRVNGGSTQLRGVEPDIHLPDKYSFIDYGEREYDQALEFTEIANKEYKQSVVTLAHLQELKAKAELRVKSDSIFQLITENAKRFEDVDDDSETALNLDAYRLYMAEKDKEVERFKGLMKDPVTAFEIRNLSADLEKQEIDESLAAKNEDWVKDVRKDVYLVESLRIMKDMIEFEDDFASIESRINASKR